MSFITNIAALLDANKGTSDGSSINNIPTTDANTLFTNGLNLLYFAAGIVAVIIIIVAGFRYITSGGDAAAVAKAKNAILYSIVGLIVIMLAFVITQFVIGTL